MIPRLENWSVVMCDSDPYRAPEQRVACLAGTVSGHPGREYKEDLEDGKPVRTSRIVMLDPVLRIAATQNTEYELGEPSPTWLKWLSDNGHKLEDYKK